MIAGCLPCSERRLTIRLSPQPNKMHSAARKWSLRKHQSEPSLGIRDASYHHIDNRICSANERLLHKSNPVVVEDPHSEVPVWSYNADCIHLWFGNGTAKSAERFSHAAPWRKVVALYVTVAKILARWKSGSDGETAGSANEVMQRTRVALENPHDFGPTALEAVGSGDIRGIRGSEHSADTPPSPDLRAFSLGWEPCPGGKPCRWFVCVRPARLCR